MKIGVYTKPITGKKIVVRTYGANRIIITPEIIIPNYNPYPNQSKFKKIYNLHQLWDAAVGTYDNIAVPINKKAWDNGWSPTKAPNHRKEYISYIEQQADSIERMCWYMSDLNINISTTDWAAKSSKESCKWMNTKDFNFTLTPEPNWTPKKWGHDVKLLNFDVEDYKTITQPMAKTYICMAGYRLANLLNALYDTEPDLFEYNVYLDKIEEDPKIYPLDQYIQNLLGINTSKLNRTVNKLFSLFRKKGL